MALGDASRVTLTDLPPVIEATTKANVERTVRGQRQQQQQQNQEQRHGMTDVDVVALDWTKPLNVSVIELRN
jgi:hypothetical protein